MAQPFVTGPAHFMVDGSYLGTTERTPQFLVRPAWVPVFNDLSGPVIPLDLLYAGEEAFIIGNFTRWDEAVIQRAVQRPAGATLGLNEMTELGTLIIHEGKGHSLKLLFPYANKAGYSSMPGGIEFPVTVAYGPDDHNSLGINPKKVHLVFYAMRPFTGSSFLLYRYLTAEDSLTFMEGVP
jgi:hypothetical protein